MKSGDVLEVEPSGFTDATVFKMWERKESRTTPVSLAEMGTTGGVGLHKKSRVPF